MKSGDVVRIKDSSDNPTVLIGKMAYIVRQSKRTGRLTIAQVEKIIETR